jgi:hypothetical protein
LKKKPMKTKKTDSFSQTGSFYIKHRKKNDVQIYY